METRESTLDNNDLRFRAVPGHLVTRVAGEAVILHEATGTYFGLNAVGARIWELIQQPIGLNELVAQVSADYDVSPAMAAKDIRALLAALEAEGLALRITS